MCVGTMLLAVLRAPDVMLASNSVKSQLNDGNNTVGNFQPIDSKPLVP